jgi:hypothetical protein
VGEGACSPCEGDEKICRVEVGKSEGKRPLGKPRLGGRIILNLY